MTENRKITVVHAEGTTMPGKDYVREEPLSDFISVATAVGIYRIKNLDGKLLSEIAPEYVGIPFDWQFDLDDQSKLYCTELLQIILQRVKPDLVLTRAKFGGFEKIVIPLEAVSNSEDFEEIYYLKNKE
jgi:hypothetical protein